MSVYDLDTYGWANAQADAIRRRAMDEIDWENVAEEIESVGKQQVSELYEHLATLGALLLVGHRCPERHGDNRWRADLRIERWRILRLRRHSPSLNAVMADTFDRAYGSARLRAAIAANVDDSILPKEAPFTVAEALSEDFFHDPVSLVESPR